jgi:hypothetical protein
LIKDKIKEKVTKIVQDDDSFDNSYSSFTGTSGLSHHCKPKEGALKKIGTLLKPEMSPI